MIPSTILTNQCLVSTLVFLMSYMYHKTNYVDIKHIYFLNEPRTILLTCEINYIKILELCLYLGTSSLGHRLGPQSRVCLNMHITRDVSGSPDGEYAECGVPVCDAVLHGRW
jgi:hypothetical protein